MQSIKQALALGLVAAAVSSAVHADTDFIAARGVFVMTNDADANEVWAYERNRDGGRAEIMLLEILAQQRTYFAIVIDDHDMGTITHRASALVRNC